MSKETKGALDEIKRSMHIAATRRKAVAKNLGTLNSTEDVSRLIHDRHKHLAEAFGMTEGEQNNTEDAHAVLEKRRIADIQKRKH
jgi:hypothetical protein